MGKSNDRGEKSFNHGDHKEHKEDDAGRRNEQVERYVIASSTHPTGYRLLQPPLASDDLAPGPALGGVGFVPWFDEGFAPVGRPVRHRFVRTDGAETPRRPAGKDMGPPPGLGRRLQRGIHATGLAQTGEFWECRAEMTARPAVSVTSNHGFPRSRAARSVSGLARPVQ